MLFGIHLAGAAALFLYGAKQSPIELSLPWVPSLGLNIDIFIGTFQLWFITLILLISGAVQLYAANYYSGKPELKRLLLFLQLFTLAMLGIVASDNLFLLFLFWELTSLCSFLLVGLHHQTPENTRKASQGLMITMLGGVGLLVGALILTGIYGTSSIQELRVMEWNDSGLGVSAMVLILLGCLTKSAQFPFHFWLPNAMAGPTPVSALLHSATMVKAGVYLLAMLAPLFSQSPLWAYILIPLGLVTTAIGNVMGLTTNDLKQSFASTTLAALGILTVLAGVGTDAALKGFVIFLTAHALYKAPLFLSAGLIESSYGTRDITKVNGVAKQLPLVGVIIFLSLASMFGLPPFPGFLAKEYALKALWEYSPTIAVLATVLLAGTVGVGLRVFLHLFTKPDPGVEVATPSIPKVSAALVPTLLSIAIFLIYPYFSGVLKNTAQGLTGAMELPYKFWSGITPPLILSIAVWAFAYPIALAVAKFFENRNKRPINADQLYESSFGGLLGCASVVRNYLGTGRLRSQNMIMLICISGLTLYELSQMSWGIKIAETKTPMEIFSFMLPLLIVASIFAAVSKRVIPTLFALGVIGILMAVIFLWFSAPDLALTQLLAEILILFLLIGLILKKPQFAKQKKSMIRAIVACAMGLMTTLLVIKAQAVEWENQTSAYYIENSYTAAFGKNVVNVILVDFRAIDTLGEITVLAIAALGVTAAFGAARERHLFPAIESSAWMSYLFKVLTWVMLPLILFTLYRGHNAPGGGFIAALLTSILIGYGILVKEQCFDNRMLRVIANRCISAGLTMALAPVFIPLFLGRNAMEGLWIHWGSVHIGTPLLFDVGVYTVVVGFVIQYLRHFIHPQHLPH